MRTLGGVVLFLTLLMGNTIPQGVTRQRRRRFLNWKFFASSATKLKGAFKKMHRRSSVASIRNIFSRSITSLGNSPDKANLPQH